jgi:23S rRNA (adenine1618-N6)-methyltransferase
MNKKKKLNSFEKSNLHPRNLHRERYDFEVLIEACPDLSAFVKPNTYGDVSIDFSDAKAVKMLNKALLLKYYTLEYWDIPEGYLCPPIPGRSDYIHYIADLLSGSNKGRTPKGGSITCLDIGVGANCIYPILGNRVYDWSFIGSDTDKLAIQSARKIVESNAGLKGRIELRLQTNSRDIFKGILQKGEFVDVSICNPPFHSSAFEAEASSMRKLRNLNKSSQPKPKLNFGGKNNELWCEGGEEQFIQDMISQSKEFSKSCFWFTTLVSKHEKLGVVFKMLEQANVFDTKLIEMSQGNKISRIVAWTFLSQEEQENWLKSRWN